MASKYNKITISGRVCTGKSTLFKLLQNELRWKTFSSSQYFRNLAKKQHKSINKAEEQNESISKKIDHMVRDILQLDQKCIVEAWMGGIMAQNSPDTLKVLLTCDNDTRAKRYASREGIHTDQARSEIEERERNLLAKLEDIHDVDDILAHTRYNVVIDTTSTSEKDVLQKVLSHIQ